MRLKTTGTYPCQWDDLITEDGKFFATVYTLKNGLNDGFTKEGITVSEDDGYYDIVINVPELTIDVVKEALLELSNKTNVKYELEYNDGSKFENM